MRQRRYIRYMAREASCIFIGLYAAGLTVGLVRLAQGPNQWEHYLDGLFSPLGLLFHLLALGFASYHALTWFQLTPKVMRIPQGDGFVPDKTIITAHYAVWGAVSFVIVVLMGVI
jgi:fumarate reductase subunit C